MSLKFTAHEEFVDGRHLIEDQKHNDLQEVIPQVVRGFKENRQIWKELEHYRQHGELLGEHPLFEKLHALRELQQLRGMEIPRKLRAIQKSINDHKRLLEKDDKPELQASRREKLHFREWQLEELQKIIKSQHN